MKKPRRILAAVIAAGILSAVLAGCGLDHNTEETTLVIDETGQLTETIVETKETDYSEEELSGYIEQQVSAYPGSNGENPPVSLESCKVSGNKAEVVLHYASCADYASFNNMNIFWGTIAEAEDAGYSFDVALFDENGASGDLNVILERRKEWKVFIVSEALNVKVPDKILYATDNVKITGRLTATVNTVQYEDNKEENPYVTTAERYAYILYK